MKHEIRTGSILSMILLLLLLFPFLPAKAEETGYFYFAAVTENSVVVYPEKIPYQTGDTIRQALEHSGHLFKGLYDGMITEIDSVYGLYTRSDENGQYDLEQQASEVHFLLFCEAENPKPSENMQNLIRELADYTELRPDEQKAAEKSFNNAKTGFAAAVTDDAKAGKLYAALHQAIVDYRDAQNGTKYAVSFSDGTKAFSTGNYDGVSLSAENDYGRVFYDEDGDGTLNLVEGRYWFYVGYQYSYVEGHLTVTNAEQTVTVPMLTGDWLDPAAFRISQLSGDAFGERELEVTRGEHSFRVSVADVEAASLQVYLDYNQDLLSTQPKVFQTVKYTSRSGVVTANQVLRVTGSSDRAWLNNQLSWKSFSTSLGTHIIEADSMEGGEVKLRVFLPNDASGYFRYQEYTLFVDRYPTLKGLQVVDANNGKSPQTAKETFSGTVMSYTYQVLNSITEAKIIPVPFSEKYIVTVNGKGLTDGAAVIPMSDTTTATVCVSANGQSSTYKLKLIPTAGQKVTFVMEKPDMVLRVYNKSNEEMLTVKELLTNGCWKYQYTLPPEEQYHYVATLKDYYHSAKEFTVEESAGKIISVDVPVEDWMTGLEFSPLSTDTPVTMPVPFRSDIHAYTLTKLDKLTDFTLIPTVKEGCTVQAIYSRYDYLREDYVREMKMLTNGKRGFSGELFLNMGAKTAEMTLRVSKEDEVNGITNYQDYVLTVNRELSLSSLSFAFRGVPVAPDAVYTAGDHASALTVPLDTAELTVFAVPHKTDEPQVYYYGYHVFVNGTETDGSGISVPLSETGETETIRVLVTSDYSDTETEILVTVRKSQPGIITIHASPAEALLTLRSDATGVRLWPDGDNWKLSQGGSYTYTLTAKGYVGQTGTLSVQQRENGFALVMDGTDYPLTEEGNLLCGTLTLGLTKAPSNEKLNRTMEAEWADFRGTAYVQNTETGQLLIAGTEMSNNGVVKAKLPISSEDSTLYWSSLLGDGYSSDALSCPILVNGSLIVYAGEMLYRVDPISGEKTAETRMAGKSSFAINNPTYYEGMLFVGLSDGRIQAFDAETLESLWIYQDALGGQPNCPITVQDGYLYTGFWVGEISNGSFVCLTVTDEDPTRGDERKTASWTHIRKGGYYWAGAYVCEDFLLVGTDDGQSGYTGNHNGVTGTNATAALLLMDPKTGQVLDSIENLHSDIRCAVSYDAETDAYYFTSKGGYFYQVRVEKSVDSYRLTGLKKLKLSNGGNSAAAPAMSTCTPVVHNGRAYIGVSGVGQFTAYSGHNLTVIDLKSWSIAYCAETQGYPQTSGLLTTAYEADTGYIYVYFFDNYTPGKLRVLRDKPGQTSAEYLTTENNTIGGSAAVLNTPYVIFTPVGDEAQYAICSPICDEYGVIYFKNDSARLMAFGPMATGLEIAELPTKMEYEEDEQFDPAGMQVLLCYENGTKRDVTDYVVFTEDFSESDTVTISFPYMRYHNTQNRSGYSEAGQTTDSVYTTLTVSVEESSTDAYKVSVSGDAAAMPGEAVAVTLTVKRKGTEIYNAFRFVIHYDADVLEYENVSIPEAVVEQSVPGVLTIVCYGPDRAVGTGFTVQFRTIGIGEGRVTLVSAAVDQAANAPTQDTPAARIGRDSAVITSSNYPVSLPAGFIGATHAKPGEPYSFAAEDNHYDYILTIRMGGIEQNIIPEGGVWTLPEVSGSISVTIVNKTGKAYHVTLAGDGEEAVTAAVAAVYTVDYSFSLAEDEDYTYSVFLTIDGKAYTGFIRNGNTITVPGSDVVGDIVITVTKTPASQQHRIFKIGSGADDVTSPTEVEQDRKLTFTLAPEDGYDYAVTVTVGGTNVPYTRNGNDFTVKAADLTGDVTISVEKTLRFTVSVCEYVKLGGGKNMYLILAVPAGKLADGMTLKYDDQAMYRAAQYEGAFAWLVISAGAVSDMQSTAEKSIRTAQGSCGSVASLNEESNTPNLNTVQQVYDIYNAKYTDFENLSVEKFLQADVNGDKTVNVQDAAAIVYCMTAQK